MRYRSRAGSRKRSRIGKELGVRALEDHRRPRSGIDCPIDLGPAARAEQILDFVVVDSIAGAVTRHRFLRPSSTARLAASRLAFSGLSAFDVHPGAGRKCRLSAFMSARGRISLRVLGAGDTRDLKPAIKGAARRGTQMATLSGRSSGRFAELRRPTARFGKKASLPTIHNHLTLKVPT